MERGVGYNQTYHDWIGPFFGLKNEGPSIQDLGGIETKEGRLLTFPNVLQHRVSPFRLADPTKSGHRKVVALFLVDPNIKIISTAHVPCQQKEWWGESIMASTSGRVCSTSTPTLSTIPVELQDCILEQVKFPFGLNKAKELRLKLMEERKNFLIQSSEMFEQYWISLCEH